VSAPLIQLDGVSCRYGAQPVLRDVTLTIDEGQFIGVVGPSGSGKTTLLGAITQSIGACTGAVTRRPGVRIAYVPQVETVNWNFPVTVGECVVMGRGHGRLLPWMSSAERTEVETVLARLGLDGLAGRHIRELSGGQQQRVFLARALVRDPDLLLLDEPTSGVDVRLRHEVLHLLSELNNDGMAILLTTHDLNGMAAHLPDLVCLNGEVIGRGHPREVLCPEVLERTYGASMEVLQHAGMPVVVDSHAALHAHRASHHRHRPAQVEAGAGVGSGA
jgi:ABC-type Mn2+/Zn2+ transport system ATPase subunit